MDKDPPEIKITDRRQFNPDGARRAPSGEASTPSEPGSGSPAGAPSGAGRPEPARAAHRRGPAPPEAAATPSADPGDAPAREAAGRTGRFQGGGTRSDAQDNLTEIARGLLSSFGHLVAQLAYETEICLGLVPPPGRDVPEPDLEVARVMIDTLSMLQEKTRGNLDPEEARYLKERLYEFRLEFVRRRSGGEAR